MIRRLFSQEKLNKNERRNFIPFVNERNFMGALISDIPKQTNKNIRNTEERDREIIQNLKKTTKEYLFDKKYKKMAEKLKKIEKSMSRQEPNYDEEVDKCFKTLSATGFGVSKSQEDPFFMDFKQRLDSKMQTMKTGLVTSVRLRKKIKGKQRCRTLKLSDEFEENEKLRESKQSSSHGYRTVQDEPRINKSIFKEIGNTSQFMTDVTNQGIKYRDLVESKKINPWRKWYVKEEVQLFPGSKVTITKLQKSIY